MLLSDISVKRPVLASVMSLLIIVFGAIAFFSLPLRELPDVDQPIVSVDVTYRGASAPVVENQVTRIIEDQLSGIDGVSSVTSSSRDGRASVSIEFELSRNLEDATNDVRNAVARAQSRLPFGADAPIVQKTDADSDPILWYVLTSANMDRSALTDYAERYLVDRLSVLDGVANVRVFGSLRPALRIWISPQALAARDLTVEDVRTAIASQNIELPAGSIESQQRDYSLRVARAFQTPEEFARLPLGRASEAGDGVVRLGDVARIELAPEDTRRIFRGDGENAVGMGIVRQSKSNALEVGTRVKAEIAALQKTLPAGMEIRLSNDSTLFIERAIDEVWKTLAESILLVVLVIFLFLGAFRAAAIPAAVIPVCLIGAFAILAMFGFSINLLTLLALVLAIGLVVDDSIVVLENAQRRVDLGEPAGIAALLGTRQVAFAVIATSGVLVAVFTPLLFVGGYVGKLFVELAVTIAGVVIISAFAALSLTPMMCSLLLKPVGQGGWLSRRMDALLTAVRTSYAASLRAALEGKGVVLGLFGLIVLAAGLLFVALPSELTPAEDRGNVRVTMIGPEGSGFEYTKRVMAEAESKLHIYRENGEAQRLLLVAPAFQDQASNRFSSGFARLYLADWKDRKRSAAQIADDINRRLADIPGAVFRASAGGGLQGRGGDDVSIVLKGADYAALAETADRVLQRARGYPGLVRPRSDYEANSPRVLVDVDRERAAALGVSVESVGRTLEATMGAARISRITDRGEEYDVILQAERAARSDPADLANSFVRSSRTGELVPLSAVVRFKTQGDAAERKRLGRLAAVTISGSLGDGQALGPVLAWLEQAARAEIGEQAIDIAYTGSAKQFKDSSGAILFAFCFALVIVFLLLAAQFESFIHPLIIMLTVPLAVMGGLFGLYMFDLSLNIYSQIGIIILIALAAKNGILIVEFANQLRDEGRTIREAILEATDLRLRPVLMTSVATVIGAVPLVLTHGAGAESRVTIGVVIVFGVSVATLFTLFVAPVFYDLLARFTRSPEAAARAIAAYGQEQPAPSAAPAE